jgi:hypothetical protein
VAVERRSRTRVRDRLAVSCERSATASRPSSASLAARSSAGQRNVTNGSIRTISSTRSRQRQRWPSQRRESRS